MYEWKMFTLSYKIMYIFYTLHIFHLFTYVTLYDFYNYDLRYEKIVNYKYKQKI